MKNHLLLLLLSACALAPLPVSAMIEADKKEEHKESSDSKKTLEKNTYETLLEAQKAAAERVNNPAANNNTEIKFEAFVEKEEIIDDNTLKPTPTADPQSNSSLVDADEESEKEDLFDLTTLEQRTQEAREIVADLGGKGPAISEQALRDLYHTWSQRYQRYQKALQDLQQQSEIGIAGEQIEDRLGELVKVSQKAQEALETSLRSITQELTRAAGTKKWDPLIDEKKTTQKERTQEQEKELLEQEKTTALKQFEKLLNDVNSLLYDDRPQVSLTSYKEKHQPFFKELRTVAEKQKRAYQDQEQREETSSLLHAWEKVLEMIPELEKNHREWKETFSAKEKAIVDANLMIAWSSFQEGMAYARGDKESAALWEKSGDLLGQVKTAWNQNEKTKAERLKKQACTLGGWGNWPGAAYAHGKAREARARGDELGNQEAALWEKSAEIWQEQAAAVKEKGGEKQPDKLMKQAFALGGREKWPGAAYAYGKAREARAWGDELGNQEAALWEKSAAIYKKQADPLERGGEKQAAAVKEKDEKQADKLIKQALALGGWEGLPGAAYAYGKAREARARKDELGDKEAALWEKSAEIWQEQAAALEKGDEKQAAAVKGKDEKQAELLKKQALALGGSENCPGAAYAYGKAREARAWKDELGDKEAVLWEEAADQLAAGDEEQTEPLKKQVSALNLNSSSDGSPFYFYRKAREARAWGDELGKQEAALWEQVVDKLAAALREGDSTKAKLLKEQALALGGFEWMPGAAYAYRKAREAKAQGDELGDKEAALWEKSAEIWKKQAAALEKGDEKQAAAVKEKDEKQAELLKKQALALGGHAGCPGAAYAYGKAREARARKDELRKKKTALWEESAEIYKEQAAALARGDEQKAMRLFLRAAYLENSDSFIKHLGEKIEQQFTVIDECRKKSQEAIAAGNQEEGGCWNKAADALNESAMSWTYESIDYHRKAKSANENPALVALYEKAIFQTETVAGLLDKYAEAVVTQKSIQELDQKQETLTLEKKRFWELKEQIGKEEQLTQVREQLRWEERGGSLLGKGKVKSKQHQLKEDSYVTKLPASSANEVTDQQVDEHDITEKITKVNEVLSRLDGAYGQAMTLYQKAKQTRINRHAKDRWSEAVFAWKGLLDQLNDVAQMNEEVKEPVASLLRMQANQKRQTNMDEFLKNEKKTQVRLLEAQLRHAESQAQAHFYEAQTTVLDEQRLPLLEKAVQNAKETTAAWELLKKHDGLEMPNNLINKIEVEQLPHWLTVQKPYYEALYAHVAFEIAKTAALLAPLQEKEHRWNEAMRQGQEAHTLLGDSVALFQNQLSLVEETTKKQWHSALKNVEEKSNALKTFLSEGEQLKESDIAQTKIQQEALAQLPTQLSSTAFVEKNNPELEVKAATGAKKSSISSPQGERTPQKYSPPHSSLLPFFDEVKKDYPEAELIDQREFWLDPWQRKTVLILKIPTVTKQIPASRYLRVERILDTSINRAERREMYADELIVKLKEDENPEAFLADMKSEVDEIEPFSILKNSYRLLLKEHSFDSLEKTQAKIKEKNLPVISCAPNYLDKELVSFNDPQYQQGHQWNLEKIDMETAWEHVRPRMEQLSEDQFPVVGILDSGARIYHEDLEGNFYEDSEGGIGIDGFDTSEHWPSDDRGHGSMCAGIIGAICDNERGIAGIAWKVKLMICKIAEPKRPGEVATVDSKARDDALQWALNEFVNKRHINIPVFNYSYGLKEPMAFYQSIIDQAPHAIIVRAAGNQGCNNDFNSSCIEESQFHKNVLVVAATDEEDQLAAFLDQNGLPVGSSHYGPATVHLAAPGVRITATGAESNNHYDTSQGTSLAAPHVAAVLALMQPQFSHLPNFNNEFLIDRLLATTDKIDSLKNKTIAGRLNAERAVDLKLPPAIIGFWKGASNAGTEAYKAFNEIHRKERDIFCGENKLLFSNLQGDQLAFAEERVRVNGLYQELDQLYEEALDKAEKAKEAWEKFSHNSQQQASANLQEQTYWEREQSDAEKYIRTWEDNISNQELWYEWDQRRRALETQALAIKMGEVPQVWDRVLEQYKTLQDETPPSIGSFHPFLNVLLEKKEILRSEP
ncbi:MAG: S8 family serine peptidase [Chthoniobacterales bacterium]|nr:S8 family serine peptidase [Chthoniobacterales bacterium]